MCHPNLFFMFKTVVIVFQFIHKQRIHSTIHHFIYWVVELSEHCKGFCNMSKHLKLISSLIQRFLKLCKKNEAFCVLIFSCPEDVVDFSLQCVLPMKTVTLFPNFNHMIATLTSAMTNYKPQPLLVSRNQTTSGNQLCAGDKKLLSTI